MALARLRQQCPGCVESSDVEAVGGEPGGIPSGTAADVEHRSGSEVIREQVVPNGGCVLLVYPFLGVGMGATLVGGAGTGVHHSDHPVHEIEGLGRHSDTVGLASHQRCPLVNPPR
jgi:hypothetical protein